MDKLYPIGSPECYRYSKDIKAIITGEYRNPKKGEWYISGAIPEAYQAKNNYSSPYHIAELVTVVTTVKYIIKKYAEKDI